MDEAREMFTHSFIHSTTHSFMQSFITHYSFVHLLVHSLTNSFIYSFIQQSFGDPCLHSKHPVNPLNMRTPRPIGPAVHSSRGASVSWEQCGCGNQELMEAKEPPQLNNVLPRCLYSNSQNLQPLVADIGWKSGGEGSQMI